MWSLIEPEWKNDPRKRTAGLWFKKLLQLAKAEFDAYVSRELPRDAPTHTGNFHALLQRSSAIADERNRLIHSTFVELKAGGELAAVLRSKMRTAKESAELDQDFLTEQSFDALLKEMGDVGIALGFVHRQVISWAGSSDVSGPEGALRP